MTESKCLEEKKSISNSSAILPLNPFINKYGLLRVGGRLRNVDIGYRLKHPTILPSPKVCAISATLLNYYHKLLHYSGQEMVLAKAREKYWIVHSHSFVRVLIHNCILCRKRNAMPIVQLMGNLPTDRLALYEPCLTYILELTNLV